MIRVRTTRWSHWRDALGQAAAAAGLACLAAVAGEGTPVQEKIQFSGSGDVTALPSSRPKDDLLSKPFEFLDRGNSVSGVVAPALAPAAFPSGSLASQPILAAPRRRRNCSTWALLAALRKNPRRHWRISSPVAVPNLGADTLARLEAMGTSAVSTNQVHALTGTIGSGKRFLLR